MRKNDTDFSSEDTDHLSVWISIDCLGILNKEVQISLHSPIINECYFGGEVLYRCRLIGILLNLMYVLNFILKAL